MNLSPQQQEMCETSQWDFSDLSALFLNCTLKRSPELSHTQGLIDIATAIMQMNLPIQLQVLIPAVENAISSNAFRPGDVLTSRCGKTIEIENTDAEGRLILCDAISKAVEGNPDIIIDFATLTGAARVASAVLAPLDNL